MKIRVAILLVLGTALAASGVCGQNVLDNPDFDVDLSSWSCGTSNGIAVWDPRDVDSALDSGSLRIDNDAPSPSAKISCAQCVPVLEGDSYRLSASVYFADEVGFTLDGSARIQIFFYDDDMCTNFLSFSDVGILNSYPGNADTWLPITTLWNLAPVGATHASVYLITWANIQDNPIRTHYDAVALTPALIFANGFESGDTLVWSSSVP